MKATLILLTALSAAAIAQTAPEAEPKMGERMKENAEALKAYSFKRRTDVQIKGQSRGGRVELVRYVDGKMETVPLETPQRPAGGGRQRGLRGRMIEKKKEEMKEEVEKLQALFHSYLQPGAGGMSAMLEKAKISRTGPDPGADVQVVATGVVKPSDSFTLIWSPVNHRPVRIEIRAEMDKKPVQVTVEYASLPDGPFYPARTTLTAPKKDLVVRIDSYDYTRQ